MIKFDKYETHPTTLPADSKSLPLLEAADANLVRDIELVLLPNIVGAGKRSPNRLNRPNLRSGISGIAYRRSSILISVSPARRVDLLPQ